MAKMKKGLFKIICSICGTCCIVSVPLTILATPKIPIIPLAIAATKTLEKEARLIPLDKTSTYIPVNMDNEPEYDIYTYSERQQLNSPTRLPASERYYGDKVVYLTFDDGPDSKNTPIILDLLQENNIKATFFVVGTEVEKYPDVLKRIYNEGHAIGNHSYNHVYRELYKSVDAYVEQLHHNDEIIRNIINLRPHISRAPGGSSGHFTKEYWDTLKNQGYIEVGWNIVSGDDSSAKAEKIESDIIQQTETNTFLWSHAIVLMHNNSAHDETVKALPNIIKFYKDQGFEFRIINSKTPPAW